MSQQSCSAHVRTYVGQPETNCLRLSDPVYSLIILLVYCTIFVVGRQYERLPRWHDPTSRDYQFRPRHSFDRDAPPARRSWLEERQQVRALLQPVEVEQQPRSARHQRARERSSGPKSAPGRLQYRHLRATRGKLIPPNTQQLQVPGAGELIPPITSGREEMPSSSITLSQDSPRLKPQTPQNTSNVHLNPTGKSCTFF